MPHQPWPSHLASKGIATTAAAGWPCHTDVKADEMPVYTRQATKKLYPKWWPVEKSCLTFIPFTEWLLPHAGSPTSVASPCLSFHSCLYQYFTAGKSAHLRVTVLGGGLISSIRWCERWCSRRQIGWRSGRSEGWRQHLDWVPVKRCFNQEGCRIVKAYLRASRHVLKQFKKN